MPKTVDAVTRALKLRATPKDRSLTLRMGVKKHMLPFEVRVLTSSDYLFVHVPPAAGIMKITKDGLVPVTSYDEAKQAQASFRQSRKGRGRVARAAAAVEMPAELATALKKVPAGYKLAYDADGKPRLVKARKRRKA